ncbi:MAG: hypothetical protein MJK14_27500 [Rivularia sp. ALOHA_DT_140]|nr:hypothetical protein [Rivularia sp. ALOHA_DT_140]
MAFTSNGESASNDVEKKTIFEFIPINRASNVETIIGEGESFKTPDVELVDSENEIKLTKTNSFEVNTQLDNGVSIAFTLEVEYDGDDCEFSIDDLLEDSSFIDELTVTDSEIPTDT